MLYIFGQLLSTTHMEKRGGRRRGRAGEQEREEEVERWKEDRGEKKGRGDRGR